MSWFRKPKPSPDDTMRQMRRMVLAELARGAAGASSLSGIVVDWGLEMAVATLVCMADGTTSLYYSSGGGVIGAGTHASVRRASDALLATAARSLTDIAAPEDDTLPEAGFFRFHVPTPAGPRSATATVPELASGAHPLSPLFAAAQGVITAIRESTAGS